MDIIIMVIAGLLCFQNANRARTKGMNPILWGAITFVFYMIGIVIGVLIEVMLFYKGAFNDRAAMTAFLAANWGVSVLMIAAGFGGFLGVRAIIDSQEPRRDQ